MRRRLAGLVMAAALATGALAEEGRVPGVEAVIQDQLNAFMVDDFATAFTFASPMIKGMFGTSERFGQMVRQGYPMVWRPGEVRFLEVESQGALRYQKVMIFDGGGVPHVLEYEMIPAGESWQINGVRYLGPPNLGA